MVLVLLRLPANAPLTPSVAAVTSITLGAALRGVKEVVLRGSAPSICPSSACLQGGGRRHVPAQILALISLATAR